MSFLELYENLLGFVLFRLYHSLHLPYPPVLDGALEDAGMISWTRCLCSPLTCACRRRLGCFTAHAR